MRLTLAIIICALLAFACGAAQTTKREGGAEAQRSPEKPANQKKANSKKRGGSVAKPSPTATQSAELIRVKISTSRSEVAVNGGYGLFADVENVGSKPLALHSKEVVLAVQPEVTRSTNCVYKADAFFPTEHHPSPAIHTLPTASSPKDDKRKSTPTPQPSVTPTPKLSAASQETLSAPVSPTPLPTPDPRGQEIVLQPNEHYSVFWDLSTLSAANPECRGADSYLAQNFRNASFVPGEYAFTVDGKAYLVPDGKKEDNNYHTFTERTALRVSIPQVWAIWAAMLGAVLGYTTTKLRKEQSFGIFNRKEKGQKLLAFINFLFRDIASAMLIGAVVTILSSRLSETQFPIKVSVNDVWGAGTVGFLSYFVGYKVIDKLVGTVAKP